MRPTGAAVPALDTESATGPVETAPGDGGHGSTGNVPTRETPQDGNRLRAGEYAILTGIAARGLTGSRSRLDIRNRSVGASPPHWPQKLQDLAEKLAVAKGAERRSLRGEIWRVLIAAVSGYARLHTYKLGWLPDAELNDLASVKALELLERIDGHRWELDRETAPQTRAFVSTVTRNGVVDALRRTARTIAVPEPEALALPTGMKTSPSQVAPSSSDGVEAMEFVERLRECVETLAPRARKIWFFRVFYEMPSKWIARHPEILMEVGHVDVTLQRCRKQIGDCMQTKGMKVRELPPGTFAALWDSCARERSRLAEGEQHA